MLNSSLWQVFPWHQGTHCSPSKTIHSVPLHIAQMKYLDRHNVTAWSLNLKFHDKSMTPLFKYQVIQFKRAYLLSLTTRVSLKSTVVRPPLVAMNVGEITKTGGTPAMKFQSFQTLLPGQVASGINPPLYTNTYLAWCPPLFNKRTCCLLKHLCPSPRTAFDIAPKT